MYTVQRDRFANMIVCKGDRVRNGYHIVLTGSYAECLEYKAEVGIG